jgi:hypothetical protein
MKNKTCFSIHLIEKDGQISAVAEAYGSSPTPFEIGYEIMASLEKASYQQPELRLRVEPLTYSERLQ